MPNKKPTMLDVANLAGVSSMTVSRAFKQNSSINNATKEKIQAAADELGYIFNSTAAAFSSNKTGFIAVTVPSINNANFAETLSGLADGLANSGLQILLGHTGYSLQEEERIIEEFLQKRPEAFIVTGGYHTPRCEKLLKSSGIPVIELWDIPNDPIDEVVGFSNAKAASLIAEHFVELGYTKIGFIGGDADRDTRGLDRRKGFLQKLQSYDLDTTRLVSSGPPPISMREGHNSVKELLERWPDTQAVMCVSDLSAFGAISFCLQNNIKVPQDLAIAGFGAYEIAEMSTPTITTVDVDARDIGSQAALKLLARLDISTEEEMQISNSKITPKVILGESTNTSSMTKD